MISLLLIRVFPELKYCNNLTDIWHYLCDETLTESKYDDSDE